MRAHLLLSQPITIKKPFRKERNNYALFGVLFGLAFPLGATFFESITRHGSLTWEYMVQVQSENPLLWIIDSAPLWLGAFASFGGIKQDQLMRRKSAEIKDIATFPSENPFPVFRVSARGEIIFSNEAGIRILSKWSRSGGDILPDPFLGPLKNLNQHKGTEVVEIDHGDVVYTYAMVYISERGYINVYSSDISERKKMESELIDAKEMAENANKQKSVFLARMSHELRTPLNAILGFTQLLKMDLKDSMDEKRKKYLDLVHSAGDHLLELINEVLDLSKVESGKLEIEFQSISIVQLVDNVISMSLPLAAPNNIKLEYEKIPEDNYFVRADPLRLKQVILNLLSNAIKYNKPNGSVTVSFVMQANDKIRLGIRDTGKGISVEQRSKLFEPFERLGVDSQAIEGTGIGLTITKKLIEAMGGSVDFESVLGEGSFFYIDLPLENKKPVRLKGKNQAGSPGDPVSNQGRKKILYIEDIPANVELMEQIMEEVPHLNLISASNAMEGIKAAQDQQPDLILMDIHLPDLDGISAFQKLQGMEDVREIPVIALTADAMPEDVHKALELGFKSYVTKPIGIPQFLKTLEEVLEG